MYWTNITHPHFHVRLGSHSIAKECTQFVLFWHSVVPNSPSCFQHATSESQLVAVLEAFISNILDKILLAVEQKLDVIPTFNFVYRLTQPCPFLLVLQRQLDEFKHSLKVLVAELA